MEQAVALTFSALAMSAVLALAATGFLVLYQASRVVNFAHGDIITCGGYVALWAITTLHVPALLGYLVAIVALVVLGLVLERVAYAPLRSRPHVVVLIATLAAALVLRAILSLWQGNTPMRLPVLIPGFSIDVLGVTVNGQRVVLIGVAAVVLAGIAFVLHRTGFGRRLRAVANDPQAAELSGINTRRVSAIAWGISGGLAALAGVLLAPLTVLSLTFGFTVMLGAFAAAVIGGFGSLRGVVVGALLVGFLGQFVGGYVFKDYASTLPFIAMLALLALRPSGLFATSTERL